MRRRAFVTLLMAGLPVTACSRNDATPAAPVADITASTIVARRDGDHIEIRNGSPARAYVATLERRYFETALALWCFGHPQCGTAVEPGATARIPLAQIAGYTASSSEAIVFWWPDRPPPSGDEPPADVKQVVVRLR